MCRGSSCPPARMRGGWWIVRAFRRRPAGAGSGGSGVDAPRRGVSCVLAVRWRQVSGSVRSVVARPGWEFCQVVWVSVWRRSGRARRMSASSSAWSFSAWSLSGLRARRSMLRSCCRGFSHGGGTVTVARTTSPSSRTINWRTGAIRGSGPSSSSVARQGRPAHCSASRGAHGGLEPVGRGRGHVWMRQIDLDVAVGGRFALVGQSFGRACVGSIWYRLAASIGPFFCLCLFCRRCCRTDPARPLRHGRKRLETKDLQMILDRPGRPALLFFRFGTGKDTKDGDNCWLGVGNHRAACAVHGDSWYWPDFACEVMVENGRQDRRHECKL